MRWLYFIACQRSLPTFARWLCLVTAIGLTGCANVNIGTARSLEPGKSVQLSSDEAIVFGRILFIGNGQNLYPYTKFKPSWAIQQKQGKACVESAGKNALRFPLSTDEDGNFHYAIPPGHYVMVSARPTISQNHILPYMEFDLPSGGAAYYLGELAIDIDMFSPFFGAAFGTEITRLNFVEVMDRFEDDRQAFTKDFPMAAPPAPHNALMKRIPGCFPERSIPDSGGAFPLGGFGGVVIFK